ncbi:MAG: GYD domain-containing protein [Planctomycetota bacterium]
MGTFFMFGRYTGDSLAKASAARTKEARRAVESVGGSVKVIYALMGEYDLVILAEMPTMTEAMKASLALKRLTGISFYTTAAMPVEEFDKLLTES